MDEERLIAEVETQRIIYDSAHPFYKDNLRKEKAWSSIAAVVRTDVEIVKTKWRQLRDAFVKSRKKEDMNREWKYKENMKFLVPHVLTRGSRSARGFPPVDEESQSDSEMMTSRSPSLSEAPPPAADRDPRTSRSHSHTDRPYRPRPHRSRSPQRNHHTAGPYAGDRSPERRHHGGHCLAERPPGLAGAPSDESYHFALSLVPLLDKLDHHRRQHAKIGILNLLLNIESSSVVKVEIDQLDHIELDATQI